MQSGSGAAASKIQQSLKAVKDWSFSAVFTDQLNIIAKSGSHNYSLTSDQMKFYTGAYESREKTVGWGFDLDQHHFDVHRFHPPLIYGRRGGPDDGQGIALACIKPKVPVASQRLWYLLITYDLPVLSAKAVPQMVKFSERFCKQIYWCKQL